MHVLVTGASGFLGCHVTAKLLEAGHDVRAFVRSPSKLDMAMAPFSGSPSEVVVGDVTNAAEVADAVKGCDAVIHTANVYTYDPRRSDEMSRTNVIGTEAVLEAAVAAGCDPVVHVSTAQTFWPSSSPIDGDPPVAPLQRLEYSDSKKRAEQSARAWQNKGAPVVTTYPGGIFGPHDPGPGEQLGVLRAALVPTAPFRIRGGFPVCDIDWVTAVHVALLEPDRGPRRVTCTGSFMHYSELFEMCRRLTGRSLPTPFPSPEWLGSGMGRMMDSAQRFVPFRLPFGREAAWILFNSVSASDDVARALAGPPPPLEETIARAIRWAAAVGHLTARQAGRMAADRVTA